MTYVNIKVTREGVTPEQKARLIRGVTNLLVDVLDKKPATTFVDYRRSGHGRLGRRRPSGRTIPQRGFRLTAYAGAGRPRSGQPGAMKIAHSRRRLFRGPHARINTERPGAVFRQQQQASRHGKVFQEHDQLNLIAKRRMK